ncbi:helix-turn-helix transcriptional regulator [Halobellus ordinarius]|uniref:helix-turn-helix transcriptional regulator n=1 Tax=Halobellus ordinarius TaxID=3075120 RepID=UPI0028800D6A|nr:MarR family transcriptional regulator [Halobellus sp. ZY16]
MNRHRADVVAAALVGLVLLIGSVLSWQAFRQRRALDASMGSMMDGSMTSMHGPNPLWYVLGTLVLAAVVAGLYLAIRSGIPTEDDSARGESSSAASAGGESPAATPEPSPGEQEPPESGTAAINPEAQPQARVLDLLPDDERRILEPVLSSPGITQIELRDRSGFSKSKVSQTVSGLESRGLLYRERQGRTYRIYPSEDLQDADH